MKTQYLIDQLEAQLSNLKAPLSQYSTEAFEVWEIPNGLDGVIRTEVWGWGCCTSETCSHVSHDPYTEGVRIYVTCREIGENEDGDKIYQTPSGQVWTYRYAHENGYHFAPSAYISI